MKNKKVTIRITESQFRRLSDRIIEEQTTKSNYMRNLLEKSDFSCRNISDESKSHKKSGFNFLDIIKRKNHE